MTIAYLSSEHGQEIQKIAYEEIAKAHAGEDPWEGCLNEEKSEYMISFVKVWRLLVCHKVLLIHLEGGSAILVNA